MTIWYAQNSSVDIDSVNEWNDAANGTGNWLTWASLGAGDILCANGKTAIAINVDFTCTRLSTAAEGTGAAGGGFTVTTAAASRTITANLLAGTTPCVVATLHATNILTILGDSTGGGSAGAYGLHHSTTGAGKLVFGAAGNVRTITGGSNATAYGYYGGTSNGLASTEWYANIVAGTAIGAYWYASASTQALTLHGNITSSATAPAIAMLNNGRLYLDGNMAMPAANAFFPIATISSGSIFQWLTADGGTITLYDATTAHVLKVPEYPAEGTVADGTQYDYTPDKGTRIDCPVNQAEYTGTPYYGNPASLVDGNLYGPNLDTDPGVVDAAAVVTGAHFGVGNATQGTAAGGGGYTYGSEDQAYVLTTAGAGAGTYQPVAVGDVQDGVAVGVSPAVGTFTSPPAAKVIDDTSWGAGGVEFTGTYHATAVAEVLDSVSFGAASAETGTYHAPDAAEVISTAVFGPASGTAGTYVQPVTGQVLAPAQGGTAFGPSSATSGTLTFADTTYVLSTAPDYGIAGTGGAKTATLTAAGNVLTGTGAFGVGGTSVTPSYTPDFPDVENVATTDTVNGTPGTLDVNVFYAAGYADGEAAGYAQGYAVGTADQLATDEAAVFAEAAWIVSGHSILGQAGTFDLSLYTLTSGIVWPAVGNVSTVEAAWGPTGAEYAGALDLTLYVLISNVVSAAYVVTGNSNYAGGDAGTYPTTATTEAAQLATDQAAVFAAAASIKDDTTILGQAGTYDFTAAIASGYADGEAAQLVTDAAAVDAVKAGIRTTVTVLGVTGTLDLSPYTLIAGVAAAGDVRSGVARYTGGPNGTCAVPAATDVQLGVAVDATTGTFAVPAVEDVRDGTGYGAAGTEFTGTLAVDASGTYPDPAYVHADAGDYGPTGTEYSPELSALANWTVFASPAAATDCVPIRVAAAVATEISRASFAGELSKTFTATFSFGSEIVKLEDVNDSTLTVDVLPAMQQDWTHRAGSVYKHAVTIKLGIRRRIAATDRTEAGAVDTADVTGYCNLLYEVINLLAAGRNLPTMAEAVWDSTSKPRIQLYDESQLKQGLYIGWAHLPFIFHERAV